MNAPHLAPVFCDHDGPALGKAKARPPRGTVRVDGRARLARGVTLRSVVTVPWCVDSKGIPRDHRRYDWRPS